MNKQILKLIGVGTLGAFAAFGVDLLVPTNLHADQPHMQAALDALETAEHQLNQATADKGGHRVKALKHVHAAMSEVRKAIEFDRKH
jgi:hypothetical protein